MKPGAYLHMVGINCPPELDEKFNKWYNETHVPMLMKSKAVKRAYRGKITRPVGDLPQYLAIYEFDSRADYESWIKSPEMVACLKEADQTWKEKKYDRRFFVQYEVLKDWQE